MSAPKSTATKAAAEDLQISSPSAFKKRREGRVIKLPSGMAVRARRVDIRTFISQGEVPNPLLPIVEEALNKGKKADVSLITGENGQLDTDLIDEMYQMVNNVVMEVVTEPKINPLPEGVERDDELLYIDEVEDEDKMFLFQWAAGGTEDIATFRLEAEQDLASLGQVSGGARKTK